MSYQSIENCRPVRAGSTTNPAVMVSASSGRRSGVPIAVVVIWNTVGTPVLLPVGMLLIAFSVMLPPPPCTSNRSLNVGSRTSRDTVVRKRRNSAICRLMPVFHELMTPLVE